MANGTCTYSETFQYISCPDQDVSTLFSTSVRRFYLVLTCMSILLAIATILPNALFLAAMMNHRGRNTTGQKMLTALSGVDLMQGLAMWPLKTAVHNRQFYGTVNCELIKAMMGVGLSLTMAATIAIYLITLEQYLAIAFPFFYKTSVTFTKLLIALLIPSTLNVIAYFVLSLRLDKREYWSIYYAFLSTFVIILAAAIIALQGHVAYIAFRTSRRIGQQNLAEGLAIRKRARAMKTALLIIFAFLIAYSPAAVLSGYLTISKDNSLFLRTYMQPIALSFGLLNSVVNPLINFWRSQHVRSAVKQLFTKRR